MYLWLGINVDQQLSEVKERVKDIEQKLNFSHSNFTLPFHISLKMSFPIEDNCFEMITNDIQKIYQNIHPFNVEVQGIEYKDTICWIKMKENKNLDEIHDLLNEFLLKKYSIPLHEYDLDYQFHTTLFMDDDSAKVKQAYQFIKDAHVEKVLKINKMIIGGSMSGTLGTYKVYKEYLLR